MIEINLLPEGLRKAQKKKERSRIDISKIPLQLVAIIAVAVFVLLQILAATTLFFKKNTHDGLEKRLIELGPDYKVAQSLKLQMARLNNKLSAINELTAKSILWSKKMSDLSSAVTGGVWLKELILEDEKGPRKQQAMLLKGSVVSYPKGDETAKIGNFINSLKSHEGFFRDFENIKLESSQIRRIAGMDVMDFNIICYFKKGRSYFDKPDRPQR